MKTNTQHTRANQGAAGSVGSTGGSASDDERLPCFDCGARATWLYMPASELPEEQRWACDEHVPRGCSCNDEPKDGDYENPDPANWEPRLDEKGRKLPCCEWWYLDDPPVVYWVAPPKPKLRHARDEYPTGPER